MDQSARSIPPNAWLVGLYPPFSGPCYSDFGGIAPRRRPRCPVPSRGGGWTGSPPPLASAGALVSGPTGSGALRWWPSIRLSADCLEVTRQAIGQEGAGQHSHGTSHQPSRASASWDVPPTTMATNRTRSQEQEQEQAPDDAVDMPASHEPMRSSRTARYM